MGLFDRVEKEEFEAFRLEVNGKLEELAQEIKRKATDSELSARAASENALAIEREIRGAETRVTSILEALEGYKGEVETELQTLQREREGVVKNNGELAESMATTKGVYAQVLESRDSVTAAASAVVEKVAEIERILAESQSLPENVANTKKLLDDAKDINDAIQNLLTHSMKRKGEIDELHKEIYGHDIKNSEGQSEHVDGLRDELESAYDGVADQISRLESEIQNLVNSILEKHNQQLDAHKVDFEALVTSSKNRISAVNEQLEGLLPGAMAEGLSAAYEQKKIDEIAAMEKSEEGFRNAIWGMVAVSLIPFVVDVYLLGWKGADLVQVIKDTPSLIVAILPLYFPVLWLAYSANKKLNLSKRLIEEYTHKAVLGKTFSGLSNQIETLQHQGAVKEELRTRLLFNVLQVSAENPGKLITNYSKSDHPLMEALENSAKLSDSVETLAKLPGFAAIAKKLSEKSDELIKVQGEKITKGLAAQESLEATSVDKQQ